MTLIGTALYMELLRDAPRTGRCPVLLQPDAVGCVDGVGGSLAADAVLAAADVLDPRVVLTEWWPHREVGLRDEFARLPDDPVGASDVDLSRDPETFAAAAAFVGRCGGLDRLAMVDATRPADVLAIVGGTLVPRPPERELARLCAVLRRWEGRWGAMLSAVDSAVDCTFLHLPVGRPPTDDRECRRAAAEHVGARLVRPDPPDAEHYTRSTYSQMLRGARTWRFRWAR